MSDGSSGLEQIELSGVPALNNEDVRRPDGRHVFVSANDWHIYEADWTGGPVRRVTNDHEWPFMHATESAPTGRRWPISDSSQRGTTGARGPTSSWFRRPAVPTVA